MFPGSKHKKRAARQINEGKAGCSVLNGEGTMTTCPYCRQKFSATPALNEIQKFTEHLNEAHLSRGRNIYTVFDALRVRKGWDTRNIGEGQDRQIALPRG